MRIEETTTKRLFLMKDQRLNLVRNFALVLITLILLAVEGGIDLNQVLHPND